MAGYVLGDILRGVGFNVGHRQHGNLVAVLGLYLGQDFSKTGAVRAVGLQKLQHQHLAAIIGQIVKLELQVGEGKARSAPRAIAGRQRQGT